MEFLEIFPEIGLIKEKDLQEKIVLVWKRAMKLGGWKENDLFDIPFTLLIPGTQVNLVEHTRAVTNCAIKIADALETTYENIKVKRDYLVAGGLLHDVGKLIEYEYREDGFQKSEMGKLLRHPVSGANLASEFELPGEVIHIIYTHSKEGDNYQRTIESIIIHHSDFINFETLKRCEND